MAITLYDATVSAFTQTVGALEHFVNRLNRFWIPVWAEV